MTIGTDDIIDQAIAWQLRHSTMAVDEWQAFIDWLDAAPAHAAAFDRVSMFDREVEGLLARERPVAAARPMMQRPQHRFWAIGGGAAAAAAILAVVLTGQPSRPSTFSIATASGKRQQIALADGTRIELNGGTRIELDRNDERKVAVLNGEALFTVHHSSVPFRVQVGDLSIEDVGTVFNVVRSARRVDVQVAEGAIRFDPDGAAILVKQGGALSARLDSEEVLLSKTDAQAVGSWRSGRLTFRGEPVSTVLGAITRQSGTKLSADPELSVRPFTGMITLSGDAQRDIPHVAALIGASWRHDGEDWVLSSQGSGSR